MAIPQFVNPLTKWWTFGLFSILFCFSCYEYSCHKHLLPSLCVTMFPFLLGKNLGFELLGHVANLNLTLHVTVFQSGYDILHSHQLCMMVSVVSCPCQHLLLSVTLICTILEGNGTPLQYSCPGKFHGQRSLVGYSPQGCKESDTTEGLHFTLYTQ